MLNRYFSEVQELSKELGKQLWVIIQRMLMSVRREPTLIVTALRIIEREERCVVLDGVNSCLFDFHENCVSACNHRC